MPFISSMTVRRTTISATLIPTNLLVPLRLVQTWLPVWRDIDVETLGTNHVAVVVAELLVDDDNLTDGALDVDDSVSGANRNAGPADGVEGGGQLGVVVAIFVRHHLL
jgi:hypothetical protein